VFDIATFPHPESRLRGRRKDVQARFVDRQCD
jgi:hypothetical protein